MLSKCSYERIDDAGLHLSVRGESRLLEVDTVVICAGQLSNNSLQEPLEDLGVEVHVIGGAERASELDARRAFDQGMHLAARF